MSTDSNLGNWHHWSPLQFLGLALMLMPIFLAAVLFALLPLGAVQNFKDRRIWFPSTKGWWTWTYRDTNPTTYWLAFIFMWTFVPFACADLVAMTLNAAFGFHVTFFDFFNAIMTRHRR
jgi:hypothetical protein